MENHEQQQQKEDDQQPQQKKDEQQQQQQHIEEEQDKQQHQKRQEVEGKQQQERQKQGEEDVEIKQNHTVSQFPLSKRSRTSPKMAQSPPSDHSPFASPLSSVHSSLSHGFSPPLSHGYSPPQLASQPSDSNSKPLAVAASRAELTSSDKSTATTVEVEVEVEEQSQKLGSASGRGLRPDLSILRRTERDKMIRKALLGFRISGFVFCMISFSVLAADKDQGWALDSFYNYKEFRYCLAVNVIGFVYSGIQAYDLSHQLVSGKRKPRSRFRCYLDFILDQILAYLLISASSSAAVRVDDWEANWGKDKFPEMARASMALSLVAFFALAFSSLISGYILCTFKSM